MVPPTATPGMILLKDVDSVGNEIVYSNFLFRTLQNKVNGWNSHCTVTVYSELDLAYDN